MNANELAAAHWSYIRDLLITHGESERVVELIGWHYRTAMVHGIRHGVELASEGILNWDDLKLK